jgi:hypothetical protein
MAITFRGTKGSSLSHSELDQNFREFFYSASYEGSNLELHKLSSVSSSVSIPLSNPVGLNGAIQFKKGSAVSGANAQFTGSQNLTFVDNNLKVTGSVLIDASGLNKEVVISGSTTMTQNLTVQGTLTAEEFVTERNTTIQIYNSGSTIFGDSADDSHERTGSLKVLGAFNLVGSGSVTNLTGSFSSSFEGRVRSTDTIASGSFSGSFEGEGSGVTGIISSSYAVSASVAPFTGITGKPTLVSSSIQLGSDISGSFTSVSESIANSLDLRLTTASSNANIITFTKGGGSTFNLTIDTGSTSGISSVVADTTPQLGGNLDLNTKTVSGSGTIDINGNISGSLLDISGTGTSKFSSHLQAHCLGIGTSPSGTSGQINATKGVFSGHISGSSLSVSGDITGSALLVNGAINATGDVTAFHSSDERLKDNITPIESAIDKINQIGGYEFDWNSDSEHSGHDVGVIAQEIEKVLPEVVTTRENGFKAVRYEKIVALLIQALKEQQSQIDDLTSRL